MKKDYRVSCNCQAMASRLNHNEVDEIQQDLQVFASLWSSLRAKYEGTNITKTIARLLHMYQPEEGIDAYGRLLKTVYVLLEDFDVNGLRLLVSMVPPPKNSTEEAIKDVFFKATGFVRLDAPIFHQNFRDITRKPGQSLIPTVVNPNDDDVKKDEARENIGVAALQNVPGNVVNISGNEKPNKCRKAQGVCQEFPSFRGFPQGETEQTFNKNPQKGHHYTENSQGYLDQGSCYQGYKMNWVQAPFVLQNGNVPLSSDFLVKTEDNKYLRVPMANVGVLLPCNSQNMQAYYPYQLIPANRQNLLYERNQTFSRSDGISQKQQIENKIQKSEEKQEKDNFKAEEITNEVSILDNLTVSKNLECSIDRFLNRVKNNTNSDNKRMNILSKRTEVSSVDGKEFISPREINPQNDANELGKSLCIKNCDLAAYKKQYYDAILNYQRAKGDYFWRINDIWECVEVANSLTPVASASSYDPAYYEYLQQQQWMYQHQQRLIMSHHAAQRLIQPEFSCIRNPYVRRNEWISTCTTARHSQELNSGYYNNFPSEYEFRAQNSMNPQKIQPELKIFNSKMDNLMKFKENGE